MRPFEVEYDIPESPAPSWADVRLRGYFDTHGVERLESVRNRILESGNCRVILDLEELDYISSAGIGSIMALSQELRRRDGAMVLLRPSRRVMDLLNILGFSRLFPIANSRTAAGELIAGHRPS